jgi:F-type H+-transporting ATPase subunit b
MPHAFAVTAAEEGGEAINPLLPALPDLVWGTIVFVIVLVAFIWKILPNLNKALDARAEAIEGGLKKAEEAQAQANAALENYQDQLAEARAEAARIREQARADAQKIAAEVKEQASADAARIVATAQAQIDSERAAALVSLRAEVGTLALDLASGVIGESLSEDKKAKGVVDRFIKDLEAAK